MKQMSVNQTEDYTQADYDNLHSYRSKIRRKHPEMNFQIKLGGGKCTVRRTS